MWQNLGQSLKTIFDWVKNEIINFVSLAYAVRYWIIHVGVRVQILEG